jgi:hypothetical protein
MRFRALIGSAFIVVALGAAALATNGDGGAAPRRWAAVYLPEPTLIGNTIVQGPVLFTHDDDRMARREPCTTVRLFVPGLGPTEEIASFHCIPRRAVAPAKFTYRTAPNVKMGFGCVLTEYQFAGDPEAHGVPILEDAH